MVLAIHNADLDKTWLNAAVPLLEKEYNYWMDPSNGHIRSIDAGEEKVTLNVYNSFNCTPRPEAYVKDRVTAFAAEQLFGRKEEEVYRNIRATAESGWDFSSRWNSTDPHESATVATINTCNVVPVDLNSFLYRVELGIAQLLEVLAEADSDDTRKAQIAMAYKSKADRRACSMNKLLWDASSHRYRDYHISAGSFSSVISLSDYAAPLWAGLYGPRGQVDLTIRSLQDSDLLQCAGASMTNMHTGEQWDAPNAWPNLQLMLVEGLERAGDLCAAEALANAFLEISFNVWKETGFMHEKYNAFQSKRAGSGGEYVPQVGFGWTNGVALVLLVRNNCASTHELEREDLAQVVQGARH